VSGVSLTTTVSTEPGRLIGPASDPLKSMAPRFVFGRCKEIEELKQRFSQHMSFVFHGPSGCGKTLLLRRVIREFPNVLYCSDASSPLSVFQSLALALLTSKDRAIRASLRAPNQVKEKSAICLRGIVLDALPRGNYFIVLDHLRGPAAALSAHTRDLMFRGNTPVVAVARSAHMEDLGFLTSFFALRTERMRMTNFGRAEATQFAQEIARRLQICAKNLPDFLERLVSLSNGSPGAIVRMLKMGTSPKYRVEDHIKISPLYIDFRLAWHAENAL
jgi:DNA polymerase III delta prime subunit